MKTFPGTCAGNFRDFWTIFGDCSYTFLDEFSYDQHNIHFMSFIKTKRNERKET